MEDLVNITAVGEHPTALMNPRHIILDGSCLSFS